MADTSIACRLPNMDPQDKLVLVHFERTTPEVCIKDYIPLYPRYILSADKAHAQTVLVLMPESMVKETTILPALQGKIHSAFAKILSPEEYFRHPASALFSAYGGFVWSPTNNVVFRTHSQMAIMIVHLLGRMNTSVNEDDMKKISDAYITFMKPEPVWPDDEDRPKILPPPSTPFPETRTASCPGTPLIQPVDPRASKPAYDPLRCILPFPEAKKSPGYISLAPNLSNGEGCTIDAKINASLNLAVADIKAHQNEKFNTVLQAIHANSRAQAEMVTSHVVQKTGEYMHQHLGHHIFRVVDQTITGYCLGSLRSATVKTIEQSTTTAMDKMQNALGEVIEKVAENKVKEVVDKVLSTSVPIAIDRALRAKTEISVDRALSAVLEKNIDQTIGAAMEKAVEKGLKGLIGKSTLKTVQDALDDTLHHKMGRSVERALYEKMGKSVDDALTTHTEAALSKACSSAKFERLLDTAVDKVLRKRAREDEPPLPPKKVALVLAKNRVP